MHDMFGWTRMGQGGTGGSTIWEESSIANQHGTKGTIEIFNEMRERDVRRDHKQVIFNPKCHDHKWVGYEVIVSSLAFGLGKMDVPLKLRSKASLRMSLGWKPSGTLDDT